MFDQVEGDLIDAIGGEVLFQAVDSVDSSSVRQCRSGIDRIRASAS
jgi:hypothetical protein